MTEPVRNRLVELRRELHRFPEPGWREFRTTARLVDELEAMDLDEVILGRDLYDAADRFGVPDEGVLDEWLERARSAGAREDVLDAAAGGFTGAIAVVERGDGPTVALRVDIDGLLREEATEDAHEPAREGFRSEHEGVMHACGHDGHMTIGLGVLEAVLEREFSGTLKVFFQPAEELAGGGHAFAESGHLDGVDDVFAVHVGLDHPTGEVVAGIERPLATAKVDATFTGESAHAGFVPNEGRNAMQAAAAAVQNAYGIARHADGMTRVNVGKIQGGSASNVVAEAVHLEAEVRGETTELMEYMQAELERVFEAAAEMHDCEVDLAVVGKAPRADSDPELAALVGDAARAHPGVDSVLDTADFGASEDATYLMQAVQQNGGRACYSIVGTDHPTGHHTRTFDLDEATLPVAVDVLANAVLAAFDERV